MMSIQSSESNTNRNFKPLTLPINQIIVPLIRFLFFSLIYFISSSLMIIQSFLIRRISFSSCSLFSSSIPHFSSKTLLNFLKMNQNRNHGRASNPHKPSSFSSNRQTPNHPNKFNTAMNAIRKVSSSHIGTSQLDTSSSRNTPIFDDEDFPTLDATKDKPKRPKGPVTASISSESTISGTYGSKTVTPQQNCLPTQAVSMVELSNNEQGEGRELLKTVECRPSVKFGLDRDMGHNSPENSETRTPQYRKSSPKREYRHSSLGDADKLSNSPFDICKKKSETFGLKASLFEKNRERRKVVENSLTDDRPTFLRPGMVLLKNYLTNADQINIVKKCRELGIGEGGFYQPGYKDGAKLRLHMMCLGKDWDPQIKRYGESRLIDGAKPPKIPAEFKKLVSGAIRDSHAKMQEQGIRNPDGEIPWMDPDICIVNFYTNSGKLGLHQDRDESYRSINNGLPVVSFSIGDTAEFLYGDERDADKAQKVMLNSGDVLIFGGESRLVFHGVPSIVPDSAPKFLAEDADLRPGRLNLTFRKY